MTGFASGTALFRRPFVSLVLVCLGLIGLSGCETTGDTVDKAPAAVEDRSISAAEMAEMDAAREREAAEAEAARTRGISDAQGFEGSPLEDPMSPLSTQVFYFEYDSFEVRPEYRSAVQAHAEYLASNPTLSVTLEGHADERGTREYNLALGEKRALELRRQMVLLGANANQIRTFSYGEEKPLAEGSDEQAYARNRRVELVY
jgi:peptidoglycan-associated lipoprotein